MVLCTVIVLVSTVGCKTPVYTLWSALGALLHMINTSQVTFLKVLIFLNPQREQVESHLRILHKLPINI